MKFLKKRLRLSKHQRGISLLEVMLSLSIIAIILVMATRYFFTANNTSRINESVQQINGLVGALNSYRSVHGTYDAGSDANTIIGTLVSEKFFPEQGLTCTNSGTSSASCTMQNPWGTDVTMPTVSATGLEITYTTDTAQSCTRLSSSIANSSCVDEVLTVTVGTPGTP